MLLVKLHDISTETAIDLNETCIIKEFLHVNGCRVQALWKNIVGILVKILWKINLSILSRRDSLVALESRRETRKVSYLPINLWEKQLVALYFHNIIVSGGWNDLWDFIESNYNNLTKISKHLWSISIEIQNGSIGTTIILMKCWLTFNDCESFSVYLCLMFNF